MSHVGSLTLQVLFRYADAIDMRDHEVAGWEGRLEVARTRCVVVASVKRLNGNLLSFSLYGMLDAMVSVADSRFSATNNREAATLESPGVEEVVKGTSGWHNTRPHEKSVAASPPMTNPAIGQRMRMRLQVSCPPSSGREFS